MTVDQQLDEIFDKMDTLMTKGDWNSVSKALNDLVFTEIPDAILVGYAAACYPGHSKIYNYRFFIQRLTAELTNRVGKDKAKELVKGFDS